VRAMAQVGQITQLKPPSSWRQPLTFNVALRAVALRLEGWTSGMMTGSTRSLVGFRGFVQCRFEIQRSFCVLFEQRFMTGAAIALGTLQVRGVIKRDVPILGCKRELLGRSLLILGHEPQRSTQTHGDQTRDESTHANKGSTLALTCGDTRAGLPTTEMPRSI
jgi:hypothetical protein